MDRSTGQIPSFPPGDLVYSSESVTDELFADLDEMVRARCREGRLIIETDDARLVCLIHHGAPFLAGLVERSGFSRVPLRDLVPRVRQLDGARARLVATESPLVMMIAVHFAQRPTLEGSSTLIDPAHILAHLASRRRDASLALERNGKRTLLFLHEGRPARLYFGDPADDPGAGQHSLEERVLLYAFAPDAPETTVAVFEHLKLDDDPLAGRCFVELQAAGEPPPPTDVCVYLANGREVRRRPFTRPEMIIGRDPAVDLFIDNLTVSRRHARLSWENGEFMLEDLGSANGTSVNGVLTRRATIGVDDTVEIGKFKIAFEAYDQIPAVQETLYIPTRSVPPPAYLVSEGERLSLERDRLIGSSRGADVRARGFRVRPIHARISFKDGDFELSCFGGAKARVGGKKVRRATLSLGDEFRIGRTEFAVTRG